jgi:putative endonuclease
MSTLRAARQQLVQSVIGALDQLPSQPRPQTAHLETGREGELAAFFYLRKLDFTVVARGWRSSGIPGDIDLIAWEGDTVCFVEVKTRSTRSVASAEAAVDEHKRKTLRRLAGQYLRHMPESTASRFDVLSIYFEDVLPGTSAESRRRTAQYELFRGAFDWSSHPLS